MYTCIFIYMYTYIHLSLFLPLLLTVSLSSKISYQLVSYYGLRLIKLHESNEINDKESLCIKCISVYKPL